MVSHIYLACFQTNDDDSRDLSYFQVRARSVRKVEGLIIMISVNITVFLGFNAVNIQHSNLNSDQPLKVTLKIKNLL